MDRFYLLSEKKFLEYLFSDEDGPELKACEKIEALCWNHIGEIHETVALKLATTKCANRHTQPSRRPYL